MNRFLWLFSCFMVTFYTFILISCNSKKQDGSVNVNEGNTAQNESGEDGGQNTTSSLPLGRLVLPSGFSIDTYVEGIDGARSMAMGKQGTLFVGTRNEGNVYAIRDADGDFKADEVLVIATDLEQPNGVAFKDGALYVAEVSRLLRYPNIEQHLNNPPEPEVI